jgi:hypothetical protein
MGFLFQWVGLPIACVGIGFGAGWKVHDWKDASGQVNAVVRVTKTVQQQGAINTASAQHEQAAQDHIQIVTKTIIREVPTYVTPAADARCVVPTGFVRLHDAAASGVPPVPAGPGDPDDAASGVELSAVASTVAENYGVAHMNAERLTALQGWLKQQAAIH